MESGKQIHAHVLKFGLGCDPCTLNNLIHMYIYFQSLHNARRVFDTMPHPNSISWVTLISGYSRYGFVDEAFTVFQSMPDRNNTAAWNAILAAYVQNTRFDEAFALFDQMRREEVVIDKFVAASMLSACTGIGSLEKGKWIHKHIQENGIEMDSKLATAIVDMYCKCGCLEKAIQVFSGLSVKPVSCWNAMIGGLAMHGKVELAIHIFKDMEKDDTVVPDNITFVNLLTACAHSGMVKEGRHYFNYMTEMHRIEARMEHYGCLVDMYGRAGMLKEAKEVIDEMMIPMSPDASVLGAFVGACKKHNEVEIGEGIGEKMVELEPSNSGRYVLLANLYEDVGELEDIGKAARKLMYESGVSKEPGVSKIEVGGVIREFTAGGRAEKEVYDKVKEMLQRVRYVHKGYKEDESSEYHSEKLAMAFGLLRTKPGETLLVWKNLRVCKDCHEVSKLISKVYEREIIVRDRYRFHHFKMGECSCKDYW
ncbi:Pentatricopeptide repeat-containing protein ELI1, chloroplastic [Linum perenne]